MAQYTGPLGKVTATQAHIDRKVKNVKVKAGEWIVWKGSTVNAVDPETFQKNYRQIFPRAAK